MVRTGVRIVVSNRLCDKVIMVIFRWGYFDREHLDLVLALH